jgi:hypothetical protein
VRKVAVGALVVLTTIAFTASALAVWSYRQVLNSDVFADRVESIVTDPEVIDSLANYLTDEVMEVVDPEALLADVLPAAAQRLAGPITAAIRGLVFDASKRVLASPTFQQVLVNGVERAHRAAIKLLEGDRVAGFEIVGDQVVLNTLPLIQEVLNRISEQGIFGDRVQVPPVTDASGNPSDQIQAIAERLGVDVPPDFGQLTVFQTSALEDAQRLLKLVRRTVILLILVTLVLLVLAIVLSTNRWRTVAQLGIGLAIAMLVVRFIVRRVEDDIVDLVRNPDNLPAVVGISDSILSPLESLSVLLLVVGLLIAALGFFLGRSDAATRARSAAARQAVRAGHNVKGVHGPVTTFIVGHPDACRLIAVALGGLILLWSGFTLNGLIIALVVTGVLLLVIAFFVQRAGRGLAEDGAAPPGADLDAVEVSEVAGPAPG